MTQHFGKSMLAVSFRRITFGLDRIYVLHILSCTLYTASNPILVLQTKKQQTLRYFQNVFGNSAEDGSLSLLMQIDVEILPSQRETTPPPQREVDDSRLQYEPTMIFSPKVIGDHWNLLIYIFENLAVF